MKVIACVLAAVLLLALAPAADACPVALRSGYALGLEGGCGYGVQQLGFNAYGSAAFVQPVVARQRIVVRQPIVVRQRFVQPVFRRGFAAPLFGSGLFLRTRGFSLGLFR